MIIQTQRRGFTLAELMVSLGVIAIGIVGLASSLYFGFIQSQHGDRISKATQQARVLIETTRGNSLSSNSEYLNLGTNLPRTDSGLNDDFEVNSFDDARPLYDPPFDVEISHLMPPQETSRFRRRITLERTGLAGEVGENLLRMSVTIYWQEKEKLKHVTTTGILTHPLPIP